MKTELEEKDMDAIAEKVVELIRPLLSTASQNNVQDDEIFTVESLCRYIGVSTNWVYERTSRAEIPFLKVGRFVRFRKSDIDHWMSTHKIPVMNSLSSSYPGKYEKETVVNGQR